MPTVHKSVKINAPIEKVFTVVTAPDNWTRYVTSLVSVTDLSSGAPKKGSTFKWVYSMLGIKFSGKGEVSEYVRNKSFGLMLKGKAEVKESYDFASDSPSETTLDVKIEYTMPSAVVEAIMNNRLVAKLNQIESKNVLNKIKAMCEG